MKASDESRPMAQAIRFDQMIRDGVVADQAELARVGHVSRARLTQIMNLLSPAPEIQEELHFLLAKRGSDIVTDELLRPIAGNPDSRMQSWMYIRQIHVIT